MSASRGFTAFAAAESRGMVQVSQIVSRASLVIQEPSVELLDETFLLVSLAATPWEGSQILPLAATARQK